MKLLDLFCGAGGAAMGYHRVGFDVLGVDIKPQPRYPFEFVQADALEFVAEHGQEFDVIHASPPCQSFTCLKVLNNRKHPDLLTPTRESLNHVGKPWIIENVPGAPMRVDLMLCGSMFGESRLKRHRWFEFWDTLPLMLVSPCAHAKKVISVVGHGGVVYHTMAEWREVMGIDWMTRDELAQAIPPTYTEWIGQRLQGVL